MLHHTVCAFALIGLSGAAAAQEGDRWNLDVGAGGLYAPAYEGDDSYRLSALPSARLSRGDRLAASVENGVSFRWLDTPALRAGPVGRIEFPRDEDGDQTFAVTGDDTTDLRGLGDVDASLELGGFLEYVAGPVALRAEARKAVSGHEGVVADFSAQWSGRAAMFGPPVPWSAGPRLRVVDDAYTTTYFGVNAAQSAASGLPIYRAGGGLYSYGVGANAVAPLSERWALVAFAGYDRLTGDAGDSPLVQQRGSQDQFSAGLFVSYRLF